MQAKYRANIRAIELAKELDKAKRHSTPDERKELAKYVGWGGMKGVFDPDNKGWAKQHAELKALLTDAEWKAASKSQRNAHYTSVPVVKAIYRALEGMGFSGGRVLEPSVGVGNFFGLMPAAVRQNSRLHGVELDAMTSLIVRHLYPNAKIAGSTGFQNFQIPAEYFDLVIGNPPFGSEPLVDNEGSAYSGWSIHNYFFGKSIEKVRPGGLVAMVVSHNLMDRLNPEMRRWMGERAELVDAVRLPNVAFKDNANTEVVTDILVFKKLAPGEKAESNTDWLHTVTRELTNPKTGETAKVEVNKFFDQNPDKVLGTPSAAGTMYSANEYTVEPVGDWKERLDAWAANVPPGIYSPIERTSDELDSADNAIPDGVKVGNFYVADGQVRQRITDALGQKRSQAWEAPNNAAEQRMRGMIDLRSKLRAQMRLERDPTASEAAVEDHRKELARDYDAFVKKHGYLNSDANRRVFIDDTEVALLQALEFDYDPGVSKAIAEREGIEQRDPSAVRADILSRRVLFPPNENMTVSSAKDALLASLNERGRVDMAYMRQVYDKPEAEIEAELGDVVFRDPASGDLLPADAYLSGDVKTRLEEAKRAAQADKAYQRNVEALEKVIPADKMPSEIYAAPGAPWIPQKHYDAFFKDITGGAARLLYVPATAQWMVREVRGVDTTKNAGEYGTPKMQAHDIFEALLNGKAVEVKKRVTIDGQDRLVTDEEQTEAARAKADKIRQHWDSWVWADPDRAVELAAIYNDKHNRRVERKFDGSHMTFPGMSPAITLLAHQKNAVWRGIQDRNQLLDHVVGAGKTFEMAALAMEMRRMGVSRKPLFVVPNHLTLQWRGEFARLYPGANVLAATPSDFSKDNRKKLFSKIATGNWDAVIVGHSSLKKIGLPPEAEEKIIGEQLNDIKEAIETLKRERGDRNVVRDMEGIAARLEARMEKQKQRAGKKDDVVNFDELGIDALFVDEMHEFKNLFFTTQMQRVSGLGNPSGSGKAFDLFVKVRWLQDTFGENAPLITATGTPVSNSLSEMFTMQRFMKYPEMRRDGLHLFDAWAKQYGDVEAVYEVAPSGVGYRISQRFSKFRNLGSLMGHYRSFADVITLDDLKAQEKAAGRRFPVPKIKGGKPENIVVARSQMQTDFFGVPKVVRGEDGRIKFEIDDPAAVTIEELPADPKAGRNDPVWVLKKGDQTIASNLSSEKDARERLVTMATTPVTELDPKSLLGQFANLRELTRNTKGKINALSLTGLANKAGLDYRLIDPTAPDHPGSKINVAVDRAVALWKATEADKGTQLIFCDLSVPLSARAKMAHKPKRVFVRDADGRLTHKLGTLHAVKGREGYPFYMVKNGSAFDLYEPVSGAVLRSGFADRNAGVAWVEGLLADEAKREKWLDAREERGAITEEEIAEYRDQKELESDPDNGNEISMADLEGVASATAFSVYDDIKAKLIAKGVPAHEIEFIHDHDTPTAKDKVFKRVKSGQVRFLMGSTPKLGAGTNVQDRLVGLHHIDAPWRPSDLEQREGRIIRRGNRLYERDPDGFEVFIGRYATEQTYDTRRWQLLEHKASGIEQLRKYAGQAEIEDVASEAANSADMKAAASGNPLILTETQLRTEVKRLMTLERAHKDNTLTMARRAEDQREFAERYGPRELGELRGLIARRDAAPHDPEKPVLTLEGQDFEGREAILKRLAFVMAEMQTSTATGRVVSMRFRGLQYSIQNSASMVSVNGPTGVIHSYLRTEQVSTSGLLTRIQNAAERLDHYVTETQAQIERARSEASKLRTESAKPFAEAEQLKKARADHAAVQRRLMKSSQSDAVKPEERAEFAAEVKQRRADLERLGYGDTLRELDEDAPKASRGQAGAGVPLATAKQLADAFEEAGLTRVNVAATEQDLPAGHQKRLAAIGAKGVRGAYFPTSDDIWVIADRVHSPEEFTFVTLHEGFHRGLRKMFPDATPLLRQMWRSNAALKQRVARIQADLKIGRDEAIEEALADMAGEGKAKDLTGWAKLLDLIRGWLAKVADALGVGMTFTDEMIETFVAGTAGEGLKRAPPALPAGQAKASRSLAGAIAEGVNDVRSVRLPAGYLVGDLFNGVGKLHWWHKSVGTMHNLAQRSPLFRRVYDAVQSFLGDVSLYATEAADEAPTILPKLETWRDLGKTALSAADTKAIAAPIFEGTLTWARDEKGRAVRVDDLIAEAENLSAMDKARILMRAGKLAERVLKMWQGLPLEQFESMLHAKYERDMLTPGVVWSDGELRSKFQLTDAQIGHYREFRRAVDKSLANLAVSDMIRFGGKDVESVRDRALAAGDVDDAAMVLRDHLFALAESDPDRAALLNDTANKIVLKADRATSLMKRGYAPLSRFGSHTVYATDEAGEQLYFGMFETAREASRMARQLREQFPDATIQRGTVSQEEFKLFAGVSPETLALFGEMLGLEQQGDDAASQAFQTYLKLAKNNRSALKRLIHRKGVEGFNEDVGRVLAGFVYSNARQTSSNLHMGEITAAASEIPKGQGELKDAAVRLADYIKNPQEEAQGIRGVLFAQYLGGSVASALVNMTQPLAVTFPYLSQYGGAKKAAAQVARALADVGKASTGDERLDEALKKAEEEGIVSPQEVHQLMAQARGRATLRAGDGTTAGDAAAAASNALSRLSIAWGKVFGLAEQVNRRATFIAAYRTAVASGMDDPAGFAKQAVNDTQFVYNKGSKPKWARGAVGSVLFTFKQYSISYVELVNRLWNQGPEGKKAALLMLAMLFLMAGADGLPFADDANDVIDGVLQRLGYNFSTRAAKQEFFASVLGEDLGRFAEKGLSALPGVPIDLSGRLGLGNLIPGSGLLVKKADHTRDVTELLGPAGDLGKRAFQAAGQLLDGDPVKAATTMSPVAARNVVKAFDMASTGMYRDDRGRKVIDVDGYDAVMKGLGFQPTDVARVQDATFLTQQLIGQNKVRESEIADLWARGLFEQDQDLVNEAREALARWNKTNPSTPIKIDRQQIRKRVAQMRASKTERIAKTAPKEIRAEVRRELEPVR